jgi:hypothetical protein
LVPTDGLAAAKARFTDRAEARTLAEQQLEEWLERDPTELRDMVERGETEQLVTGGADRTVGLRQLPARQRAS